MSSLLKTDELFQTDHAAELRSAKETLTELFHNFDLGAQSARMTSCQG